MKIKHKKDEPPPMTMVIVGLPGGLELRYEKMKELVTSGKLASYPSLLPTNILLFYFLKRRRKIITKELVTSGKLAAYPSLLPTNILLFYFLKRRKKARKKIVESAARKKMK
jgi:hypothetical protein